MLEEIKNSEFYTFLLPFKDYNYFNYLLHLIIHI